MTPTIYSQLLKRPALWLAAIAAITRLLSINTEALWYDESFTAAVARLDFRSMWTAVLGDVHPPLWYIIEWLTVRVLGDSEFALRLPAAIFGVIAVLLLWKVAQASGLDHRTAWLAGLFAAILPAGLYYSQEARMYSLLTCCVLLLTLGALRSNYLMMIAGGVGAVYTQNYGLLYVASIGIIAFLLSKGINRLRLAVAVGLIALAWAGWLPSFLGQTGDVADGFWLGPLTPGQVVQPFALMIAGNRLPEQIQLPLYALTFAVSLLSMWWGWRWLITRKGLIVLGMAVLPAALAVAISLTWRPIYLTRGLLPSVTLFCVIWAMAISRLNPQRAIVHMSAALIVLSSGFLAHYFPSVSRDNIPNVVRTLNVLWQPQDHIYITSIHAALLYGYYLPDKTIVIRRYSSDLNQSLTDATKAAFGLGEVALDEALQQAQAEDAALWVAAYINPMSKQDEINEVQRLIDSGAEILFQKSNDWATQIVMRVE